MLLPQGSKAGLREAERAAQVTEILETRRVACPHSCAASPWAGWGRVLPLRVVEPSGHSGASPRGRRSLGLTSSHLLPSFLVSSGHWSGQQPVSPQHLMLEGPGEKQTPSTGDKTEAKSP